MSRIALLFPGQGSQYIGMSAKLYNEFEIARQTFEEANDVLGFDLSKICFEGSLSELNQLENMFAAILTSSMSSFRVYMQEIGITPHYAAGHSLGEYSALACSGFMSFQDALKIVYMRGKFVQESRLTHNGTMTVVNGVPSNILEDILKGISNCSKTVCIACYNAPEQYVISGHHEAVMEAENKLFELDAQITPMLLSPPLHSPLMEEAASMLKAELKKYVYNCPQWPVISNVTALPSTDVEGIVNNMVLQMTRPVRWSETIEYLEKDGVTITVEMGTQAVLSNLVKMHSNKFNTISLGQKGDIGSLLEITETNSSSTVESSRKNDAILFVSSCLAEAVCTQNKNHNKQEYEKGVIEPYERIEAILEELESNEAISGIEQMEEALANLRCIFFSKKLSSKEQNERLQRIFEKTKTHIAPLTS